MRFLKSAAYVAILAVALCGCRTGGDISALQRENFQLEEQITALEVKLDQCCRELHATRDQLAARERASVDRERRVDESSPSDLPRPPKIELGPQGGKEIEPAPKFEPRQKNGAQPNGGGRGAGPDLGHMHNVAARQADQRVAAITLHPEDTSGYDADATRPGDEGIVVVVEPRNLAGESVRVPGEMSVMAFDLSQVPQPTAALNERHSAHVGTWHFTRQDAETWFDEDRNRMRLELPWPPAGGPRHKDLLVLVKYKTDDGRLLEAKMPIKVQLTGQRTVATPVAAPPSPPVRGAAPSPPAAARGQVSGEFSALKKPASPTAAEPSRPAGALPPREQASAPADVSDGRAGAAVPSRQRPVWTPYR